MRFLILLLFTLVCTRAGAQNPLAGKVLGADGREPLTGAYVYPKNNPGAVVTTDTAGTFSLEISRGDTLLISYLGYETLRYAVGEGRKEIVLLLSLNTSADLEEVTVRGRKIAHGELASTRIGQLAIYLDPASKADPLLAVNRLPAATNPDETANVSLRGSPSEATGIYLNDVPIRSAVRLDQSNGVGQFSLFGTLPLREVSVYAAAPPVSFSQSAAGAVAIVTNTDLPETTTTGINLHLAGAGVSRAQKIGERTGVRAFLNLGNTEAFQLLNQGGLPELEYSGSTDGILQLTHKFNKGHALQLFYLGFHERYRYAVSTPYYSGTFRQEKPRHLGIVNNKWDTGSWELALNNSFDWERGAFRFGNIHTTPRRWHAHTAAHATKRVGGHTFKLGAATNYYDDLTSGTAPLLSHRLAPEMESVAYSVSDQQVLAEVYAYGQHRLGNKWLLGAGLKPIHDVKRGSTRLNTQASLRYQPGPREKWHLSAGRFAQLLSPGPEITIWQWLDLCQVALEYSGSSNQWSWEAAVFAKTERYDRLDDLFVLGAEAKVNFKSEHWTAWISTTSVRNRGLNINTPTRRDLPFFARTQVQRKLGGQWNLGLAGSWRRGTYFRPLRDRTIIPDTENWFAPVYADEGSRLPNYLRLDLSVSKIFIVGNGSLIVYLNVNNLLNSENVSAYTYDADFSSRSSQFYSRRLLFVGATYQFTPGAD